MPCYEDFQAELLWRFPEWEESYRRFGLDSEDGSYVVCGVLVIDRLEEAVEVKNESALRKAFGFFEEVAAWDSSSEALIHIEIGEWLVSYPKRDEVQPYAGPFVLDAVRKIEDYNVGK